jgi:hypothetical protein
VKRLAVAAIAALSGALIVPSAMATHGPAHRAGDFSCRASVLRFGTLEPVVANGPRTPCKDASAILPTITVGPVTARVLQAATDVTPNDPANTDPAVGDGAVARATVASVDVGATGLTVHVGVLRSSATVGPCTDNSPTAPPPALSAETEVVGLVVNSTAIEVPAGHQDIPLGALGTIHLNEIDNDAPNSIRARALFVEGGPLAGLTISESIADFEGNPCQPPPPREDCPPAGNPKRDPFVDPTAPETRGQHPDCTEFSNPGGPDATGEDFVHFVRAINDTETSPNGSLTSVMVDTPDSRNRFNGKAGFIGDDATTFSIKGDIYDDEDMRFRMAPLSIDAYFAPNDLAESPWRRFCGTGVIMGLSSGVPGGADEMLPTGFDVGEQVTWLIETFDKKFLDETAPGGDQSDYFVIDIYKQGNDSLDTKQCDPDPGQNPDDAFGGPNDHDKSDYHSEGQTIAGNIQVHSSRVPEES